MARKTGRSLPMIPKAGVTPRKSDGSFKRYGKGGKLKKKKST